MKDEKKKPEDGEVTEEQLADVSGGVLSDINFKVSSVDGEAKDRDHGKEIDIIASDPTPNVG